jgi:nucleoside-diphosphate-sugar epimerase
VTTFDLQPGLPRLEMIAGPEEMRRVRMEVGRIEDTARVKALIRDGGITNVVHLAAVLMPFCQARPVEGALVNVIGTLNIFEAARDAGRPVRITYASSAAVWGPEEMYGDSRLAEDAPLKPTTHYGVYKHANEENARVFFESDGISSIGLRPWTVYGVGRDRGLTADPSLAMRALAQRRPFQIRLTGFMDMQYVRDVAETFVRCVLAPVEGAHVFNLRGDEVTMEDFIKLLDRIRPGAAELITARGGRVPVAHRMDDSLLRRFVSDIPHTPLEIGVRHTLDLFERLDREGRLHETVT